MLKFQSGALAAQRLVLAVNHELDYLSPEDMEDDVDLVVALLEEARDECWPELEARARAKAKAEQT